MGRNDASHLDAICCAIGEEEDDNGELKGEFLQRHTFTT